MIRFLVSFLFFMGVALWAAPTFPDLTGRVVDQAGLLTPQQEQSLSDISKAIEQNTTAQVVVVTLKSLEGYDIADYGYQLGRYWKIGQKDKNNGLLIIVAPNEHKVRIEVGYGLEGDITDAISHDLIQTQLIPHIKQNDIYGGLQNAMGNIQAILTHDITNQEAKQKQNEEGGIHWIAFILIVVFMLAIDNPDPKKEIYSTKNKIKSALIGIITSILIWVVTNGMIILSVIVGLIVFFINFFATKHIDFGSAIDSSNDISTTGSSNSFDIFSGGGGSFGGGGASGSW